MTDTDGFVYSAAVTDERILAIFMNSVHFVTFASVNNFQFALSQTSVTCLLIPASNKRRSKYERTFLSYVLNIELKTRVKHEGKHSIQESRYSS